MLNANEAYEAANAVPFGTTGSPERASYQDKHNAINEEFFAYLNHQYAADFSPSVVSKIRYNASQASSGSGFIDTEHHYCLFAEFAQAVLSDSKK